MPRLALALGVFVHLALGCTRASPARSAPVLTEAEGWEVQLEVSALEDLPPSCFRSDALVLQPREDATRQARWAWVPGTPGELYVGRLSFSLGDAGDVEIRSVLRGSDGVFRATQVRSLLKGAGAAGGERDDMTLVLQS